MCINLCDGEVYVAVALVARFIVFKQKEIVFSEIAKLDANIVVFDNGFVAVDRIKDGFIFLNRKGNITTFSIR